MQKMFLAIRYILVFFLVLLVATPSEAARKRKKGKAPLKGPAVQFAVQVEQCSQPQICETKNIVSELIRRPKSKKGAPPRAPFHWSKKISVAANPASIKNSIEAIAEVTPTAEGTHLTIVDQTPIAVTEGVVQAPVILAEVMIPREVYSLPGGVLTWVAPDGLSQIRFYYAAAPTWIEQAGYFPERANIEKPLFTLSIEADQCRFLMGSKQSPAFACKNPQLVDAFYDVRSENFWLVTQAPTEECSGGPVVIHTLNANLDILKTHTVPFCQGPRVRVKKIDSRLFISWPGYLSTEKQKTNESIWIFRNGELKVEAEANP